MPISDVSARLEVGRANLAQALKIVARVMSKDPGDVGLAFDDGCLSIEAGDTVAKAPASGIWPAPIFVAASWVRLMARKMPPGDPLVLRVEGERLYLGPYSERCSLAPTTDDRPDSDLPQINEQKAIRDAAGILKPLHVRISDLEELVAKVRAQGEGSWSVEDKRMISIVAKAWVLLAPLGVETSDIHRLVRVAVRDAWK